MCVLLGAELLLWCVTAVTHTPSEWPPPQPAGRGSGLTPVTFSTTPAPPARPNGPGGAELGQQQGEAGVEVEPCGIPPPTHLPSPVQSGQQQPGLPAGREEGEGGEV